MPCNRYGPDLILSGGKLYAVELNGDLASPTKALPIDDQLHPELDKIVSFLAGKAAYFLPNNPLFFVYAHTFGEEIFRQSFENYVRKNSPNFVLGEPKDNEAVGLVISKNSKGPDMMNPQEITFPVRLKGLASSTIISEDPTLMPPFRWVERFPDVSQVKSAAEQLDSRYVVIKPNDGSLGRNVRVIDTGYRSTIEDALASISLINNTDPKKNDYSLHWLIQKFIKPDILIGNEGYAFVIRPLLMNGHMTSAHIRRAAVQISDKGGYVVGGDDVCMQLPDDMYASVQRFSERLVSAYERGASNGLEYVFSNYENFRLKE